MAEPTQSLPPLTAAGARPATPKHALPTNTTLSLPLVKDPRTDEDGGVLVVRNVPPDDVELMREAVRAGVDSNEISQEYLEAVAVQVAAAGGTCTAGPVLIRLEDPLRFQVRARIAPATVAERFMVPEPPPMLRVPEPTLALREAAEALPKRRDAVRVLKPRWTSWVLWIYLVLLAAALWSQHVPPLMDTAVVRRVADVPVWVLFIPLLPWLAGPARQAWLNVRARHDPTKRKRRHKA